MTVKKKNQKNPMDFSDFFLTTLFSRRIVFEISNMQVDGIF